MFPLRSALVRLVVFLGFALLLSPPPAEGGSPSGEGERILAQTRELLDAERPDAALEAVGPLLTRQPDHAEGLLLRSTAHFMLGDVEAGRRDLERSLELDPGQRQAWLNRAALDLAEERLDEALEALERARDLDPAAPENDLNIGAVRLLKGELAAASRSFERYLERHADSADAYYLVASNYAMAGYAALAVQSLRRAIAIDERSRLRARTDPNFTALEDHPSFQEVLAERTYTPPPGAYLSERTYGAAYDGREGKFLGAVIDALHFSGEPFESRVEVTADWAVVWGEIRLEVSRRDAGRTAVQLSTSAGGLSPAEWRRRAARLLDEIGARLDERGLTRD